MIRLKFYAIDPIKLDHHIREVEVNGKQAEKVGVLQGVKDWTEEGLNERVVFPCTLSTLSSLYPNRKGIGDAPC